MTDDDGVSLTSIAHPLEEPRLAGLIHDTIKVDPNLLVKQYFAFRGVRKYEGSPRETLKALIDDAWAWLDAQPKVHKWIRSPEFGLKSDFETGADYVQVYGRGWFDTDVRLGDMVEIYKEL